MSLKAIFNYKSIIGLLSLLMCYSITSQATENLVSIRYAQGEHLYAGMARHAGRGFTSTQSLNDLIVQNFSVVNVSEQLLTITEISVSLFHENDLVQMQIVDLAEVEKIQGLIAQYQSIDIPVAMEVVFGASEIIKAGEIYSNDLTLDANEAVVVTDTFFTYKGKVDKVKVTVTMNDSAGNKTQFSNDIMVLNEQVKNDYIFPLESDHWYVYSNIDPAGHHRFTQNSEFAIDATLVDKNGRLFKGDGMQWQDWYAYNKEVLAAADGIVVKAVDHVDFPLQPLMKQTDEAWAAYTARIGQRQMRLMKDNSDDIFSIAGGNHVVIEHENGEYSWYVHLAENSIKVKPGQQVKQGEVIAGVGGTGENPNVHLHFQITDGMGVNSRGLPFQFIDVIPIEKTLNTNKPIDAGRFIELIRPVQSHNQAINHSEGE